MLMTMQEARDTLRVDGTDNDAIIESLLESIPSYLEVSTGYDWGTDADVHPLAQTTAKFVLQLWFDSQGPDTERLKRTIDSLMTSLTAIGRTRHG